MNVNAGKIGAAVQSFAENCVDHENGEIVERWGSSEELGILKQLGAEIGG